MPLSEKTKFYTSVVKYKAMNTSHMKLEILEQSDWFKVR